MSKGVGFVNFKESNILGWQKALLDYCNKYGDLFFVSDTETTGIEVRDEIDGFNRVIEWSGCFCYKNEDGYLEVCKDENGEEICIDEVVNPFYHVLKKSPRERQSITYIPEGASKTNGITLDYLFLEKSKDGKDYAAHRQKLDKIPSSFRDVFLVIQAVLSDVVSKTDNTITAVFHNAPFDVKFLDFECDLAGVSSFESYFGVVDTMDMSKQILKESKMSLDSLYEWGKENCPHLTTEVERPIHTAMIDSLILVQAYNILVYAYKNNLTAK